MVKNLNLVFLKTLQISECIYTCEKLRSTSINVRVNLRQNFPTFLKCFLKHFHLITICIIQGCFYVKMKIKQYLRWTAAISDT